MTAAGLPYATGTKVTPAKSQADIQAVLLRYGATSFALGFNDDGAGVEFVIAERHYRVKLPFPPYGGNRAKHDAEIRRRWRSLLLIVKSKLEATSTGLSTLDEEFALYAVLPDGRTAGEHLMPAIEQAYTTGKVPDIMAALTGGRPALEQG